MKKLLLVLPIIPIAVFVGYKYVFRPTTDLTNKKSQQTVSLSNVVALFNATDTAKLSELTGQVISVTGPIGNLAQDDSSTTITLSDTGSTNSITCQMDSRYLSQTKSLAVGQTISLKGECTGHSIDDILGGDLQLKGCVLEKGK